VRGRDLVAVEYAERFAVNHTSIDGGFVERLRGSFSDPGIFGLTVCLSAFLGLDERCGRSGLPRRR
jgi:hypothetical protein